MKPIIWIATTNKDKAFEFSKMLPNYEVKTIIDLPDFIDIEENGETFEENALIKAKDLANKIGGLVIADDSGICCEVLNGFPGVNSKRWAYPITDFEMICQKLIDKINAVDKKRRNAMMVTSIAIYDSKLNQSKVFNGIVNGKISDEVKFTESGFGYDYIFIPNGSEITYSMMGNDLKNKESSRRIAIDQIIKYLNDNKEKYGK